MTFHSLIVELQSQYTYIELFLYVIEDFDMNSLFSNFIPLLEYSSWTLVQSLVFQATSLASMKPVIFFVLSYLFTY